MRKILTLFARLVALTFAVLFVLATVLALLLFNAERQLFSAEGYKRALAAQNLYERFPALIAEQIVVQASYRGPGAENPGEEAPPEEVGGPSNQFKYLTQSDYEVILRELLPAEWLQTQTESVLDQIFAFLNSESPTATIQLSTVEFKARLSGEAGVEAVLQLVRSWPPCTPEQLRDFTQATSKSDLEGMPTCRPPDDELTALTPRIESILSERAAKLPDEINLAQSFSGPPEESEINPTPPSETGGPLGNDPRAALRRLRWIARLSPLISIALLLLVALFGVRSRKGGLRWWGIPLLIAGVLTLGLGLAIMPAMDWAIANFLSGRAPPYFSANLVQAGFDFARATMRGLANWIAAEAAVIGLLGLGMLLVSFYFKPKPKEPAPGQPPEPPLATTTGEAG